MNKTEKAILVSAGIVGLAVIAGSFVIAEKLSRSLDEKDFWKGSNIPAVANDVHNVTNGVSQGIAAVNTAITSWTRV
ncbi:hypothetical protein E7T09_04420 [Deinococcus sp. KSM4-11]|uniref:hypothetical protein n=1 Tax=Deinococcus sp. KSM4-11 TaxID=2568654 RepID=UPI0010A37EE0|nr:hypothetical protein [Deinococcus sp. KSM4-11]THF88455.1 hypothetical protein E7T09_04420 [Deinococcus sp. KSM4-11]